MLTCLYFWTWTSTSEAASGKGLRPLASQKKSASPTCSVCNPLQMSIERQGFLQSWPSQCTHAAVSLAERL